MEMRSCKPSQMPALLKGKVRRVAVYQTARATPIRYLDYSLLITLFLLQHNSLSRTVSYFLPLAAFPLDE